MLTLNNGRLTVCRNASCLCSCFCVQNSVWLPSTYSYSTCFLCIKDAAFRLVTLRMCISITPMVGFMSCYACTHCAFLGSQFVTMCSLSICIVAGNIMPVLECTCTEHQIYQYSDKNLWIVMFSIIHVLCLQGDTWGKVIVVGPSVLSTYRLLQPVMKLTDMYTCSSAYFDNAVASQWI